ncbi:MAG: GAF domain-containing protein [Candidatus Viridilinea halotolerans]|uniref:histidine kinase n=1 Tax=Candidatus Viridilinea halotolerans TaxID=2491704 RepID=A0A426TSC4_9CHLR|nr:MAG: GAF domain-containing protein [Candidatus Viridilinea halotolerans]
MPMSHAAPANSAFTLILQHSIPQLAAATDQATLTQAGLAALQMLLPRHQVALDWHAASPPSAAFRMPLEAAGQQVGWLLLEPAPPDADQLPALHLLANVLAALTLALQCAPSPLAQCQAALRPRLAQLRGSATLQPLCATLCALALEVLPFAHVGFTMRYRDSDWIELAYLQLNAGATLSQIYWRVGSSLSSAVMADGELIVADNYNAECERRGMPSFQDIVPLPMLAWMGAPLRDQGQIFGTIFAFSHDADVVADAAAVQIFAWLADEVGPLLRAAQRYEWAAEEVRQRETLINISRAITSSLDPEAVPTLILERAPDLLGAEESSLLLLDETTGELVFHYAAGPAGRQLLGQRLPPGTGVAGHVVSSGKAAIVNDTRDDGRFYRALDGDTGFTTRSIIAVPLRSRDGVRGVLEVLNRRNNAPFIDADCLLLAALADQAIIALENASRFASLDQALTRRVQELDRLNARLQTILRAANTLHAERPLDDLLSQIVSLVSSSSGFRSAMIALVRRERTNEPYLEQVAATSPLPPSFPSRDERQPLAALTAQLRPEFQRGNVTYLIGGQFAHTPDPVTTSVLETTISVVSPSGPWQPHETLICLLRDSRGELLGLLVFANPEDGQRPSAEQVQLLEILANQAAAALENANLYTNQQQSLNRMLALNGLGRAISTTLRSPQQIYELTARGMQELSDARWAAVFVADATADEFYLYQTFHNGHDPIGAVLPLAQETVTTRRPTRRLAQPNGNHEAMIAIPLRGSRQDLGAICIGYGEGLPSDATVEMLILFASQAATAVESIGLLGAVRQGRDQLASIMASTREGMLLLDEEGRVAVANDAFVQLASSGAWAVPAPASPELTALPMGTLLDRWQAHAHFARPELSQLWMGITAVANGEEGFGSGQLNSTTPSPRSLEWTVLRATQAEAARSNEPAEDAHGPWPILLTVRDITALKETERLRSDLTNMMVHDLRSPLTSVMTSIDMIFRGITGEVNPTQREILSIAYTSAQHLLNMVNLLLDISRLEGGRMPIDRRMVPINELLTQAVDRMGVIARSKSIVITHQVASEITHVYADEELLLRVLQNLLDNALKFSPRAGTVWLLAEAEGNHQIRFSVRDEGGGIPAVDREKIFAKFGQAGNNRSSGSGLGLTFCKLVVEAHGGHIWVESDVGEGSTFFLTLPVRTG